MNSSIQTHQRLGARGGEPYVSAQGTVYAPGISAETVGAASIFLGMVTLPAGVRTKAHVHARHESAFYMLSGEEVALWTGPALRDCVIARPGDYLSIPAGMPHVAVNCSDVHRAVFIGARNESSAQESVVMRPDLDALAP
jgi:uncharacterized RmlC-like cupin family protein